ncbi:hypothetical protein [Kiloniella sp.]|uniref:hypothetical protein n=1 Tax=Kiloniella sp. TaxID=1938587 RepID=UPI003B016987
MLNKITHQLPLLGVFCALPLVSACAANPISSHSANYADDLFASNVEILHLVNNQEKLNTALATYFYPDGTRSTCWLNPGDTHYTSNNNTLIWETIPEKKSRTRLKFYAKGEKNTAGYGSPFTFNPTNGLLRTHFWNSRTGKWLDDTESWFQNSWPRAFADVCPDIKLPADLPINEKQTGSSPLC